VFPCACKTRGLLVRRASCCRAGLTDTEWADLGGGPGEGALSPGLT
jgi:hypothetical protein